MQLVLRMAVCASLAAFMFGVTTADTLDEIQQRGVLRWGGDASGGGPYIFQGPENSSPASSSSWPSTSPSNSACAASTSTGNGRCCRRFSTAARSTSCSTATNGRPSASSSGRRPFPITSTSCSSWPARTTTRFAIGTTCARRPAQPRKRVGVLQGSAAERYVEKGFGDAVELKKYPEVTSVMGLVAAGPARRHRAGRADRDSLWPGISRAAQRRRARSAGLLRRRSSARATSGFAQQLNAAIASAIAGRHAASGSTRSTACGTTTSCGWPR